MTPCLNWREIELLVEKLRPEVEGLFVDRLVVPERDRFPSGYLKGEWAIRLTGRKQEGILLLSIRAQHPYLAWHEGKGPKAATRGTRSPFDLSVSKFLKGSKLIKCTTLPRDRTAILWFSGDSSQIDCILGLVLVMIPAAPEAFLVSAPVKHTQDIPSTGWPILSRSRTIRDKGQLQTHFFPPDSSHAPPNPLVREFLQASFGTSYYNLIEKDLADEAFSVRIQFAEKSLKQLIKQAKDRIRQSGTALSEAHREQDWKHWADLLKASLGMGIPVIRDAHIWVQDFTQPYSETDKESPENKPNDEVPLVKIPIPKNTSAIQINLNEIIAKYYQNAKRKERRIEEAQSRISRFQEAADQLEAALARKPQTGDWTALLKWERQGGILTTPSPGKGGEITEKKKRPVSAWLGKTFTSKDGLTLWVGRSKDENLELTFKHARGNDIWMHVRGRPGAHVVIPLQPGKSAPLETLLDAATLVVFYSNGAAWGKTEVDYTFKKYVKRIKDSSEASYTHNKTLLLEPDLERRKRLLDQNP